jgi:hypothetical protein
MSDNSANEVQPGKPPVAAGGKRPEQARPPTVPGQEARAFGGYPPEQAAKSSNTSLAYSHLEQEEEIILDQDDVDKASSAYLHLRPPSAPSDPALRFGPSYQAFEDP